MPVDAVVVVKCYPSLAMWEDLRNLTNKISSSCLTLNRTTIKLAAFSCSKKGK